MKSQSNKVLEGNIVDIIKREIFPGKLTISNHQILSIERTNKIYNSFILPGFIDAHVHIESSLLIPSEFAKIALKHGVIAAFCDPHEIANVCGLEGIDFMINDAKNTQFKFFFGAPSCVPATNFETSGAQINAENIDLLFKNKKVHYLSEMMNFPGIVYNDKNTVDKVLVARKNNLKVDGHAPGLSGDNLKKYVDVGIDTDHECSSIEEAREKISLGMKILMREGSAAKNLNALAPLINEYPDMLMLCTDDFHADDLLSGYIDSFVVRLINEGYELFDVLQIASLNAVKHYNIDVGMLQPGDNADFIIVNDLKKFEVIDVYIGGEKIFDNSGNGISNVNSINNFSRNNFNLNDLNVIIKGSYINLINVIDKEIYTNHIKFPVSELQNADVYSTKQDILKIVVCCRYLNSKPVVGFVRGFGLQSGAFASSIAHDSHNIIAVGTNDDDIYAAINDLINVKGGIVFRCKEKVELLPLPIAGLMSNRDAHYVANKLELINNAIHDNGCTLISPLMNLSFLSLLVIPELKISDKGLFRFSSFNFIDLFE